MSFRTLHYSDYQSRLCALMGIPVAGLTPDEIAFQQAYFNRGIRKIWEANNWLDVCPYAEARFPQNLIDYANDYTQIAAWSLNSATINTASSIQNPLDIRANCQQVLEVATSDYHGITQTVIFIPNQTYQFSFYVRGYGRGYAYLNLFDGTSSFTVIYNISNATVVSSTAGVTAAITAMPNGFNFCSISFTSSSTAAAGSIIIANCSNGVAVFYTGDPLKGLYIWGVSGSIVTAPAPSNYYIPYAQDGENPIDAVFNVWKTNPTGFLPGSSSGYQLTQYGIQLIAATNPGPVYLYYRQRVPDYIGAAYSAILAYPVGTTIYFTNASGTTDFYTCVVQTTFGQSPTTTPASWVILPIPYLFVEYVVYNALGDWLVNDGQADKASSMYSYAQTLIDDESDKQERQQGFVLPMKVQTHLTSQNRGLGLSGQSNQPGYNNGIGYGY